MQEIVGLGLANFAGSAFNAYSTTGSFSRSAVNYDSGETVTLALSAAADKACHIYMYKVGILDVRPAVLDWQPQPQCPGYVCPEDATTIEQLFSGFFTLAAAAHVHSYRSKDGLVWLCDWLRCWPGAAGDDTSV